MAMILRDTDEVLETTVRGRTSLGDSIEEHELFYLGVDDTSARITFIENTGIERTHSDDLSEFSLTVMASELISEAGATLPYGANPRFPLLCPTFDKIFTTIDDEPEKFILRNTGIDVFCNSANIEGNEIVLNFSNDKHGIANGGLTTGVISYCQREGFDLSEVRVSIRIWAGEDFEIEELVSAADARNAHRELQLADRLNQLNAFDYMKSCLKDDWRGRWSFNTGDIDADEDAENVGELCHLLFGFTLASGEAHPTRNHPVEGGVPSSIKKAGRLTAPKTGLNGMKQTVGL